MKGDNEVLSDSGSHPDSDCDNFQILSKEDVVGFLGLPKEAGSSGFTRQVGEMTVNDAMEWYALPPEHLEELHKKDSDKLAQVPSPRKALQCPWAMGNSKLMTCWSDKRRASAS